MLRNSALLLEKVTEEHNPAAAHRSCGHINTLCSHLKITPAHFVVILKKS